VREASKVILLPLLCRPRYGSSLVQSLIGESPEVLELQEMFNFFAHSPLRDDAIRFFGMRILGNASADSEELHAMLLRDRSATIEVAAAMAVAKHKPVVTFKIFGCPPKQALDMSRLFGAHNNASVAILLERNLFTASVSGEKINQGCSSFQFRDSTNCKLRIDLRNLESSLFSGMLNQCCQRGMAGFPPFKRLPRVPVALLKYEELERLSIHGKFVLVQSRVQAASRSALCSYPPDGNTLKRYPQQDKNHSLASSIINIDEMRQWYTIERRHQLCNDVVEGCMKTWDDASPIDVFDWCISASELDMPARL